MDLAGVTPADMITTSAYGGPFGPIFYCQPNSVLFQIKKKMSGFKKQTEFMTLF